MAINLLGHPDGHSHEVSFQIHLDVGPDLRSHRIYDHEAAGLEPTVQPKIRQSTKGYPHPLESSVLRQGHRRRRQLPGCDRVDVPDASTIVELDGQLPVREPKTSHAERRQPIREQSRSLYRFEAAVAGLQLPALVSHATPSEQHPISIFHVHVHLESVVGGSAGELLFVTTEESTLASLLIAADDNLPFVPALTLLWHPDLDRVGQTAPLLEVSEGRVFEFTRLSPGFGRPGSAKTQPIGHPDVSRETAFTLRKTATGYALAAGPAGTSLFVDGQPFAGTRELTPQHLQAGVVIAVRKRVAMCLHMIRFPVSRSPSNELLGSGDAIETVRRAVQRAAGQDDLSVLIRGETGTGKELVARALHDLGKRRNAPFVAVNMANVRPERATADLFGHEKGAFTGATEARLGLFRSAHGGTLFLDEVAATPPAVQQMLLRALQDHSVQAVGATTSRQVDVRVVAATDARLEEDMLAGRFPAPLYYRLAGLRIDLPPLRARREDIGVLLVHFLRLALSSRGELSRLDDASGPPWLPAPLVASLALGPWPGNVRQLQNLAGELAAWDPTRFRTVEETVRPFLPVLGPSPALLPSRPLSRDDLLAALDRRAWNQTRAAKDLDMSRETLRKRIYEVPQLRKVIEIPIDRLIEEHDQVGGDLAELSRRLEIDEPLLRSRLRIRS